MNKKYILYTIIATLLIFLFPSIKSTTTSMIQSISIQDENSANITQTSTQTNTSNIIVIDAGHGGYDSGSVSEDGVYEKDITLAISLLVGERLTQAGYEVVYTRYSDDVTWSSNNKDDLRTRVQIGEDANAAYYISIHTNASEQYDDGAYGIETYINYENETIYNMAQQIQSSLTSLGYSYDRGIKSTQDSSLYVIDHNDVAAMLIEIGFITDSEEAAYMSSVSGQYAIAEAIANGILTSI